MFLQEIYEIFESSYFSGYFHRLLITVVETKKHLVKFILKRLLAHLKCRRFIELFFQNFQDSFKAKGTTTRCVSL